MPANAKTRRWERRRAEILAVAEQVFGEKGFAGTRLEDVAERMELRRPSLVYYFADKEALYDATFAEILGQLAGRIEATRDEPGPLQRMEAIASAWTDFLGDRPDAARILLRQMVDELPPRSGAVQARLAAMLASIGDSIEEGAAQGLFKPMDAARYAVTIGGASLTWVTARPVVLRALGFDPLSPEALEEYRQVLAHLTRQLLQVPAPVHRVRRARRP